MRKWLTLLAIACAVLALDQFAKQWVIRTLEVGQTSPALPGLRPYFQITRISNTGIAFGLGEGGNALFLLVIAVILGFLLRVYAQTDREALVQQIGLALVMGGALGNVIDRLRFGHVVDFVHLVIPGLISNVSNFADHAIVLGVAVLIVDGYLQGRRAQQPDKSRADAVAADGD